MIIIGRRKKLSIIGRGTAGCLNAIHFKHRIPDIDIDWYFDPKKPQQSVGEGSTLSLPRLLEPTGLKYEDLPSIGATNKIGIRKINYAGTGDYRNDFQLGATSMHFDANKLQEWAKNYLRNKIELISKEITDYDKIDSDYIIDCTGTPKNWEDYNILDSVSVNHAYITQCYWDKPEFDYTLTIARPYGWVFGIPLQNRCSIGYLYNDKINNLDEVKEDVKNIFNDFNLTASTDTRDFPFKNYYKKNNFTDRVAYNGNASFFLEPLEANALANVEFICQLTYDILSTNLSPNLANIHYQEKIKEVERELAVHYYAGSKFDTSFWKEAKQKSLQPIKELIKDPRFINMISGRFSPSIIHDVYEYAQWGSNIWVLNLKNLGIYNDIKNKLK